jgi:hypothetical protein
LAVVLTIDGLAARSRSNNSARAVSPVGVVFRAIVYLRTLL